MAFHDEPAFPEPQGFEDDDIPTIGNDMLHPDVEFEAGMSAAPVVSLSLIVACVVIFGFQVANGALADLNGLRNMGAMDPALVEKGEVWRLLSATFLHGNFDHILGNVIMLYILGMGCEHAFGRSQFLALYVVAGLCGSLLSLTGGRVSVGASGAIFGLAGALVATLWRHRARLHVRDRRIGLLLVAWAAYQLVIGALLPQVDNRAHFGGLICGTVLGLLLHPAVLDGRIEVYERGTTKAALVLAVAALVGTGVFFVPRLLG
ncbi:MAG: gluP 5 [Planctomycetota bacterium]|nr:gluP 5 [Planctomycetota bacterium]